MNILRNIYIILKMFLKKIIINNYLYTSLRKWEYKHTFMHATYCNLFMGVYHSYDEALKHTPNTKKTGYDHDEPSLMYTHRMNNVYPADYPVLFWMDKILKNRGGLFDLGGHVGIKYYAYKKYLSYPRGFKWLVCDLPAVADRGKKIAQEKSDNNIVFTSDFQMGDGNDIVLASGSLQYIITPLARIISHYNHKPLHIIINEVPLYDGQPFVTVQNIGTAFCPYQVYNKKDFIESFTSMGYVLVDQWENAEKSISIPFRPDKELNFYCGMYLKKRSNSVR